MSGAVAAVRSVLFALIFYALSVPLIFLAVLAIPAGPAAVGAAARRWARFHLLAARVLLGVRLRVEGRMPRGAVIIAARHESMFETLQLFRLLGDPAVVAKAELFRIPGWGAAARAYGNIPVERGGSAAALRTMLRAARAAKGRGRAVLIFPEGMRVPHGRAAPLQSGFAGLYRALDLPVVPVALDSGRCWPRGLVKRAGTITFRFGEPVPPGLPRAEIEARVHAAINALNA